MEMNMEQARELLDKGVEEAEEVIQNPSKVDEILLQLEAKLKEVPAIGSTLADLPLMISMVKAPQGHRLPGGRDHLPAQEEGPDQRFHPDRRHRGRHRRPGPGPETLRTGTEGLCGMAGREGYGAGVKGKEKGKENDRLQPPGCSLFYVGVIHILTGVLRGQ